MSRKTKFYFAHAARWAVALLLWLSFLVSACAADGIPVWTNSFNGAGNGFDGATAIAVDGGDVYVTGGASIGATNFNFATIKYSSAGIAVWTNFFGAGNGGDRATALAVDGSHGVYVTGNSMGSGGIYGYATIKYSSGGMPVWTNLFYDAGNGYAKALALDTNGNVIVTGYVIGAGSGDDFVTIKYSTAGIPAWTNVFNGLGNKDDRPIDIATDAAGNVYVTGYTTFIGGDEAYATIKYSGVGAPVWTNFFASPGGYYGNASSLAVGSDGNVYVTGTTWNIATAGKDFATLKYTSAGQAVWTNMFSSAGALEDAAIALAVDSRTNIYVTGYSGWTHPGENYHFATLKISRDGVSVWTNLFVGSGDWWDYPSSLALDSNANVIVVGYSVGAESGGDYATIKYSSEGVPVWTNIFSLAGDDSDDVANAVAVDAGGNVYVTGYSGYPGYPVPGGWGDYTTIKYAAAPSVSLSVATNQVAVAWSGGALQTTTNLVNWQTVTNPANPHLVSPPKGVGFFRAVQ